MEKPMHGYELRKYFEHAQGVFWMINYGSIYPTLRNMEEEKSVKVIRDPKNESKGKITYSITEKGEKEFIDMLHGRLNRESFVRDEFTLHLFFLDYLDKKDIKDVVQNKISGNETMLKGIKEHEKRLKETLPKYRFEAIRRGRMHIETELLWLNDILDDLSEV